MQVNVVDNSADYDSDNLDNDTEYAAGTDPCDADTDNDGADDDVEIAETTDPLDPDSDNDLMPDGFEVTNACLDPLVGDAWDDGDTDLIENLHEYYNLSDPCVKNVRGKKGAGYFGDGDGNSVIGIPDLNLLKESLAGGNPLLNNVYPQNIKIMDLDGNDAIGIPDLNALKALLGGSEIAPAGSPDSLTLIAPDPVPAFGNGDTVRIKVQLTKGAVVRMGFGVVFSVVGGSAVLYGGEGDVNPPAGSRWDLTDEDGYAQIVVRATAPAQTIEIQVQLPADEQVNTPQVGPLPNLQINVN
jgi:hypothetical protein